MDAQAEKFFVAAFKELLGFEPLKWQKRLFHRFVNDQIPDACNLPTGLGKTSVIAIWLIALAYQAESCQLSLPRRLFYEVNRRTVVDQATKICAQIRQKLELSDSPVVERLRKALASLAAVPGLPVVGISTLRGELADNEEWKLDPCRPAIVIGTIDMIGSKLLFSGYGDNYKMRPFHAGLIGQDALIVHDEAHLVPAFGRLLRTVKQYQERGAGFKPFKVFELSATLSEETKSGLSIFELEAEDKEEEFVKRRLEAKKRCRLVPVQGEASIEDAMVEIALQYEKDKQAKILVYVHSPESVRRIVEQITKHIGDEERVVALTGTLRGFERDRMLHNSTIYRAFLESEPVTKSIYFVANAAGEVGLDLDADHLICDLQPADRFIQRLGRVNRRGKSESEVHVVYKLEQQKETGGNTQATNPASHVLETLQRLNGQGCETEGFNVSPNALASIKFPSQAFSSSPASVWLDIAALDRWSATTAAHREDISVYLHGLEDALPETFVAWRAEVDKLLSAVSQMSEEEKTEALQAWFDLAPIRSLERLRESPSNVYKALMKLAEQDENQQILLIAPNSEIEVKRLAEIKGERELDYATVVLSPSHGRLDTQGLLDPKISMPAHDVAEEESTGASWVRFLVTWDADSQSWQVGRWNEDDSRWAYQPLPDQTEDTDWDLDEAAQRALSELSSSLRRSLKIAISLPLRYESSQQEDRICREAIFLAVKDFGSSQQIETLAYDTPPTVDAHCALAEQWAAVLARKLNLPEEVSNALQLAAKYHDLGKARRVWQRAVFNTGFPGQPAWAKSGPRGMDARRLRGYRHELGSLIEARERHHVGDDLALHLIAAHHGWSRPLFREPASDAEYDEATNRKYVLEAALRFERLQRQYGWWVLAWLEGLIHVTDILASNQRYPRTED